MLASVSPCCSLLALFAAVPLSLIIGVSVGEVVASARRSRVLEAQRRAERAAVAPPTVPDLPAAPVLAFTSGVAA